MKIVDRLTISGEKDSNQSLWVNGDTIRSGLARVISTLFLEAVGGNLFLRTASDKSIIGLTATQFRDELDVFSTVPVDILPSDTLSPRAARRRSKASKLAPAAAG